MSPHVIYKPNLPFFNITSLSSYLPKIILFGDLFAFSLPSPDCIISSNLYSPFSNFEILISISFLNALYVVTFLPSIFSIVLITGPYLPIV